MNIAALGAEISRELIEYSSPPLITADSDHPVQVLALINNERAGSSSSFGRTLQNSIISGFVRNGIAVNETKPDTDSFINHAQAVVAGTYTVSGDIIYLSVRLVSPENGLIISSYEKKHRLDENSLQMLGYKIIDDVNLIKPPGKSLINELFY